MRRFSTPPYLCQSLLPCATGARFGCALFLAVAFLGLCVSSAYAEPAVAPKNILGTLVKKGKGLSAFKAVMSVSSVYDRGKSRQDIKGFLLYRRPSDFRFQGVAPGGNSLFELVIKANTFELYIPSEGKILKGNKECFARRFPDVAEVEALIPMILLQWREVRFDRLLARDSEKIVIRITYEGRVWGLLSTPRLSTSHAWYG